MMIDELEIRAIVYYDEMIIGRRILCTIKTGEDIIQSP